MTRPQPQRAGSERDRFERWLERAYAGVSLLREPDNDEEYYDVIAQIAWQAWLERALEPILATQARARIGSKR